MGESGRAGGVVVIVGLGNPGIEYQFTPHNAGFLAIDRLAERCGVTVNNRRSKSLTASARIGGQPVLLAKPETFMNLSGLAVQALLAETSGDASRLIVLYDDVAFPLGEIRVRERGGPGGHNGVKSICGALGTEEWLRVRIGIAPQNEAAAERIRQDRRDYVLVPFRKNELAVLDQVLDETAMAVEMLVTEGAAPAMNRFNRRLDPEKEQRAETKGE
jgi:PTH1 family peptidyl-tRNA hydrolase